MYSENDIECSDWLTAFNHEWIRQKFKMKMSATMSSQRKRKRSEKQDNTGRHQLYDWTKRTRKFSFKWKDDFPRDSLEESNRICQRSWHWQHVIWDVSATLFPEFAAVCDMYAKFSTLYALEILNIMRDYNEIYLSIFSVFHEIMLRAKWTSRNDDRISTFRRAVLYPSNPDKRHLTYGIDWTVNSNYFNLSTQMLHA